MVATASLLRSTLSMMRVSSTPTISPSLVTTCLYVFSSCALPVIAIFCASSSYIGTKDSLARAYKSLNGCVSSPSQRSILYKLGMLSILEMSSMPWPVEMSANNASPRASVHSTGTPISVAMYGLAAATPNCFMPSTLVLTSWVAALLAALLIILFSALLGRPLYVSPGANDLPDRRLSANSFLEAGALAVAFCFLVAMRLLLLRVIEKEGYAVSDVGRSPNWIARWTISNGGSQGRIAGWTVRQRRVGLRPPRH